jgi:hypothetical protein
MTPKVITRDPRKPYVIKRRGRRYEATHDAATCMTTIVVPRQGKTRAQWARTMDNCPPGQDWKARAIRKVEAWMVPS